ncbi:uncharacterized protein LOC134829813 [Culicoides brevitarsis]|uniref:uncharacterized protein LOC134829813 n=1 Tax=Culicoides brevitarsis TaxID=469753 RepID=UPI00307C6A12
MEVDVSPKSVIPAQIPHLSKLHHCVKDVSPLKTGKFSSFLSQKENFRQIFSHEQKNFLDFNFNNQNLSFLEYTDVRRLPILLQTARMGVQKLENGARRNLFDAVEYSTVRSNVCNLFRAVLTAIDQCNDTKIIEKYVNLIRPLWHPVLLTPNLKEVFVSCYDCGSTEYVKGQLIASSAKFHNIHGFLEGRWFYLEYLLKKTVVNSESDSEKMTKISLIDTEFEAEFKLFVADIVTICLLTYSKSLQDRHTIFEIFEQKSIFPCVCFLDVLYAMVSLTDFLRPVHHFGQFSDYFDEIMNAIEEDRFLAYIQSLCDRLEARKFFARLVPQEIPKFKPEQLNIFKINCLLRILKVDPVIETEIIEGIRSSLVTFVKAEPNEEQLRAMLLLMAESFAGNWDTKCDLISIFFDCIYKRINSPFFMPNSRVDSLTIMESTPQNFLAEVKKSLENDKILNYQSTSFNILVHIIGKSLTKQRLMGQKSVSNKLLGRIFSKFSISKIIALSERGLHNFVLLIVTLACSCELSEFGNRLFDILLQIQYNKLLPDRQKVLVKGHLSLLILFVDRKLSFGKHIERIVNQLKENVADQASLWELLSTSFRVILGEKRCFEEGTSLLVGNWIRPYINGTKETEKREFFIAVNDILGLYFNERSNFRGD